MNDVFQPRDAIPMVPCIVEQSCVLRVVVGRYVDSKKLKEKYPQFYFRDGHTERNKQKDSFVVFVNVPGSSDAVRVQFFFNGTAAIMCDQKDRGIAAWDIIKPAVLDCPAEHPNAFVKLKSFGKKKALYEYWKLLQGGAVGAYEITKNDQESIDRMRKIDENRAAKRAKFAAQSTQQEDQSNQEEEEEEEEEI